MTAPATTPAVEGGSGGLYRRNWDTDKTWTPPPKREPLVRNRPATPEETPAAVSRLRTMLEALGYQVQVTYAHGWVLGTDRQVESCAIRVDQGGKRVAWASYVLGLPTKKGGRSGKVQDAWHRSEASPTGWTSASITEWKTYLTEQASG